MKQPWETEPNFKKWNAYGYRCVIMRHPEIGHLCGYVGIPKNHPLYGVHYGEESPALAARFKERLNEPIGENAPIVAIMLGEPKATPELSFNNVHCGITWSADRLPGKKIKSRRWWYGFDCAHHNDICPYLARFQSITEATYKDMAYVKNITENLAFQLREIEDWQNTGKMLGIEDI